jgi:acyl-homoserine-lactone acylase
MQQLLSFSFFLLFSITLFAQKIDPKDITIVRDKWGVPHIYGKTDADAVYGMVWAHAEDNFELMQHSWAATRGRAAEILGKDGAIFDVLGHLLELDETIAAQYETAFTPEFKKIIKAYAQGANDYAAKHPKEVLLKKLFPLNERDVVAGYLIGNILMTGAAFEVGKVFGDHFKPHETQPTGSNGFAISRAITEEDKTIFCSNSHQPLEGVLSWYEVHMNSEEGWNMLGATFTLGMTPFVGTNENLGWTHTVNHPDLTDVYQLKMHPTKKLYYEIDGKWEKLEKKKLKLKVKIAGIKLPIGMKFYKSKHGMVMKNKSGYYALRFVANKRIAAAEQWYRMNKASNFEEFKAALNMVQIPCFNVVYADRDNNIYNLANGLLPDNRQDQYDWQGVLAGNTSDNIWEPTFYPFEKLPQLENPACGWVFNSNNTPFTGTASKCDLEVADFPNHLMGYLEKETNRSLRFVELMKPYENKKMSYEAFKKMKFDIQYADSTFYTYNIENLDDVTHLDPKKYEDLADVLSMINKWDRKPDAQDTIATIFSVAFSYIIDELGARSNILGANTLEEEVFVDALRKAKKYLLKHYGKITVPFGEVHIHRREKGSLKSYPMSGMPENLAAMAYKRDKLQKGKLRTYSGESFILIAQYDENGIHQVETINAFGSSNRPESPHYTDQMEMFVNKEMKSMTLDKATVLKNAVRTYSPGE